MERVLRLAFVTVVMVPIMAPAMAAERVMPNDFHYLGAFRLPQGDERPDTFAYGGNAMSYNSNGDPSGKNDGFPGSLFISGHDRMAYGELPDGGKIAEVSIPRAVRTKTFAEMARAEFLQQFHNVAKGQFAGFDELPRMALQYLDTPATGPKLHIAWGQHFEPDVPQPTHAWLQPDLEHPEFTGTWFIGNRTPYAVNDYMFEIPAAWADAHAGGRYLATGRFRDGGWSGMGPSLFAYRPWTDDAGTPARPGTHLEDIALLHYESSRNTESIERAMKGYQHPDQWTGGAWLTTKSGKTGVMFAGTKATGAKFWYGFVNPGAAGAPCVFAPVVEEYTACRLADGSPCPPDDLVECEGHNDARGWWSAGYNARFILYDPDDFAAVASGRMKPWEPQPYAALDIDEHLFLKMPEWDADYFGRGAPREYRVDSVAYDRDNGLLYVLEPFADESRPIVHVWQVK